VYPGNQGRKLAIEAYHVDPPLARLDNRVKTLDPYILYCYAVRSLSCLSFRLSMMTLEGSIVLSNAVRNVNGDFSCSRKPNVAERAFAVACAALVVYEYCEDLSCIGNLL